MSRHQPFAWVSEIPDKTDDEIKTLIGLFSAKRRDTEWFLEKWPSKAKSDLVSNYTRTIGKLYEELDRRGVEIPEEDRSDTSDKRAKSAVGMPAHLPTFSAKYDGDCPLCPRPIKPGDRCMYADLGRADTDETVIHYACRSEIDGSKRRDPGQMCQECWTIHAGECA